MWGGVTWVGLRVGLKNTSEAWYGGEAESEDMVEAGGGEGACLLCCPMYTYEMVERAMWVGFGRGVGDLRVRAGVQVRADNEKLLREYASCSVVTQLVTGLQSKISPRSEKQAPQKNEQSSLCLGSAPM